MLKDLMPSLSDLSLSLRALCIGGVSRFTSMRLPRFRSGGRFVSPVFRVFKHQKKKRKLGSNSKSRGDAFTQEQQRYMTAKLICEIKNTGFRDEDQDNNVP